MADSAVTILAKAILDLYPQLSRQKCEQLAEAILRKVAIELSKGTGLASIKITDIPFGSRMKLGPLSIADLVRRELEGE